jgi:hypothetical protein
MSIQSSEEVLREVHKVAQAKASKQGGILRADHVFAAVRQIMPKHISAGGSDSAVFESLIRTISSLKDSQLRKPEMRAVVDALKRWENLTKTSLDIQSMVRQVAWKFFHAPTPPSSKDLPQSASRHTRGTKQKR